jgi:hypothetical protein
MINGDKEAVVTSVKAEGTPTKFTSQLTEGYKRKILSVYNNSDSASGECYYSYIVSATAGSLSHPIPKGAKIDISVTTDVDVFLFSDPGEIGDIRVEEVS